MQDGFVFFPQGREEDGQAIELNNDQPNNKMT